MGGQEQYYRYLCSDCGQVANITPRDEFECDICDECYEDRMDELEANEVSNGD